jgi:hypothetical protein
MIDSLVRSKLVIREASQSLIIMGSGSLSDSVKVIGTSHFRAGYLHVVVSHIIILNPAFNKNLNSLPLL